MYQKFTLFVVFSCLLTVLVAQEKPIPDFWESTSDSNFRSSQYNRQIVPEKYQAFSYNLKSVNKHFERTLSKENKEEYTPFYLPNPKGEMELYHINRNNLLPKKLNDRYPEISVFTGYAPKDPSKTLRMDITNKGIRAVSYGNDGSTYYIDPIAKGVTNTVISYYKKDYHQKQDFECMVEDVIAEEEVHDHNAHKSAGDCQLHTFELALACTGEYAAFHGGTKASVMAEFTTSINRINGLFESEIGVTFVFVPNTDNLIFLDGNTDPYTNNNGGAMLGENQTTCDNVIGSSNYDIGHVYSTGGGGVARLQSPCNNSAKAQGVTGLPSPVGDPFYVDFVAHEIGHQFGGAHSYNNSCGNQRSTNAAFEPGSGSTIMAYAGICVPNVQFSSDAYFHAVSLGQIGEFLSFVNCQDKTSNGSGRPIIAPMSNYNIPVSTPFELKGTAAVSDGSALTYCWEQMDREIANMPPEANAIDGPSFRSYSPTASNSRYFPSLPFLLDNSDNPWEVLPGATRNLNFRFTVRADAPGKSGCTEEADLLLNVSNSAGPFLVMNPNNAANWTVGETQTVTWQVANTDAAPVNCSQVNILLSTDGGLTYPVTITENTPNDGQVEIEVPNNPGNQNRIRVQSVGNVFFDISNNNFTIIAPVVPTFTMSANPTTQAVCGSNIGLVTYEINTSGLSGFNQPVVLSVNGLPNGVNATFENNQAVPNAIVLLHLDGLQNVPTGSYTFSVNGNGGGQSDALDLQLDVVDSSPAAAQLMSPVNAANNISPSAPLAWQSVTLATGYILEVSDTGNFSNIVYTTTVTGIESIPEGLNTGTVYYWRVRAMNICGDGPMSELFRFRTGSESCTVYTNDTAVAIPGSIPGTYTSTINVPNSAAIENLTVSTLILHSYIADLDAVLVSPQGNPLVLFDRPGAPATPFGCGGSNIRATFDDMASNTAQDFEDTCGSGLYSIDDTYQSIDALSGLAGNNATGDWALQITDNADQDGGQIVSWEMEICTNAGSSTPPLATNNNPLTVIRESAENITNQEILYTGNASPADYIYTVISLPTYGSLMKNNALLQIGSAFTQEDVNNNIVLYDHGGNTSPTDSFIFDAEEVSGGWAPNNVFQINIIENNFTATAQQAEAISCFGANDGVITINSGGGQTPYMYSIDGTNFQASNTFFGLSAGEYSVTVSDNDNNITTSNTIILDQPIAIELTASVNENSVSLSVTGGTGSLMYSSDNINFQSANLFSNLPNGAYVFYVLDANECLSNTESISILVNDLSVNANMQTAVSCFNGSDAIISASVSGGDAPYTHSINGGTPQSSNIFDNLGAGQYTITVQDGNGFTATSNTIFISEPNQLILMISTLGNVLTATASGGTGAYQYSLDGNNYQNANVFENVNNGDYTVFVRDENNCTDTEMLSIDIASLNANAAVINTLLCQGDNNGSVAVNASGGTAPYQYVLNNNFQNSNLFENLSAGLYNFTVLDVNGQETSANIQLSEPAALTLQANTDQASVTLSTQGGTPPYLYSVDGSNFQSESTFNLPTDGTYQATVFDANECSLNISFIISINSLEASVFELNSILCAGENTGSITVNASGGIAPYTYSINGIDFQNENVFENLIAAVYTITISDDSGLSTTTNYTLTAPMTLSLSAQVQDNSIILNASGGTAPYEYNLDGGSYQTANQFFNLQDGVYALGLRDANGCEATTIEATVLFTPLAGLLILDQEIDCAGNASGELAVNADGGTAPYTYSLDGVNFQMQSVFTDLVAGLYTAIIRDNDGIEFSTNSIMLNDPAAILVSLDQVARQVTINALGGSGTLSYSLDGDQYQSDNVFDNLLNGDYTAFVQDTRGCMAEAVFTILVNDLIGIASESQVISCHDANDGAIVVETAGGTNPKEFSINDGLTFQSSNFFEGLSPGEYTIVIRDADGLIANTNLVVLDNPSMITFTVDISNNNASVAASGGTGTLRYSLDGVDFSTNNDFLGLTNGAYTVYIRDQNDCEVTSDFEIDFITLNGSLVTAGENLCSGDQNVSVTLTAIGGTPPYTYAMAGETFSDNTIFDMLGAGSYTFAIQDAFGGIVTLPSVEVTAPSPLNLVSQIDDDMLTLTAQGGTEPYQYSIDGNDFQDSNIFDQLSNGQYTATLIDANECSTSLDFSINALAPLSLQIDVLDILDCTAQIAGSILATATGGTPPYEFSLDDGPFSANGDFENLAPGDHKVTVRDANMNSTVILANLSVPDALEMNIEINNNDIEISITGGQAPYSYSIDGGVSFSALQIFTDLEPGEYEVTVEDANGCSITQLITITTVSVSQIDQSLIFSLQPNPAQSSTSLTLAASAAQEVQISLIDILGRTVRIYDVNNNAGANRYELDVNQIVPGTYLLRVDIDGRTAIKKLLVQ